MSEPHPDTDHASALVAGAVGHHSGKVVVDSEAACPTSSDLLANPYPDTYSPPLLHPHLLQLYYHPSSKLPPTGPDSG